MRYARNIAITRRHENLLALIRQGAFSSIALAKRLGVSDQTIYRDILFLREQGVSIRAVKTGDRWTYVVEQLTAH